MTKPLKFGRVAEWYTRYAKDVVGKTRAGSTPVPPTISYGEKMP